MCGIEVCFMSILFWLGLLLMLIFFLSAVGWLAMESLSEMESRKTIEAWRKRNTENRGIYIESKNKF